VTDDGYVPVAATTRSDRRESVHHGAVVGLDCDGSIAFAAGDPDTHVYARSALKPLQSAAMVEAGLDLPDRLLAVVCASHDGRPEHIAAVEEILDRVDLDAGALENTEGLPLDADAAAAVIVSGDGPSAIRHNCSGKHAGMLATCVVNGWPTAGYLDRSHPLQQAITRHVDAAVDGITGVGIDGCGAPAAIVTLRGLAAAVAALAVDRGRVHRAMTEHPEMVGGPRRDVTRLMQLVPGLMAKDGAEGVFVAAVPDGRAVALKIADGANRGRAPVMLAALRALGVDVPAAAEDELVEPVLGHGRPVGVVCSLVGDPRGAA